MQLYTRSRNTYFQLYYVVDDLTFKVRTITQNHPRDPLCRVKDNGEDRFRNRKDVFTL